MWEVFKEVKVEKKKVTGIRQKFVRNVKKGHFKWKSAYGCSNYKAGCDFVLPYTFAEKKYQRTYDYFKRIYSNLKDFKTDAELLKVCYR
jgi:DNA topoisomerase-3